MSAAYRLAYQCAATHVRRHDSCAEGDCNEYICAGKESAARS